jgi:L-seryl-tRNA(Ser) seleniumtransferase
MRPDKVTLATVAATLGLYRGGRAESEIPVWRMIAAPLDELEARAHRIEAELGGRAGVVATLATVGGGSLPGETLPSYGLAIPGRAQQIVDGLRVGEPAVVGRIEQGRAILDLRTVDPSRDADLTRAILDALRS